MPNEALDLRGFRIRAASLYNQKNLQALDKLVKEGKTAEAVARTSGDKQGERRWSYCINVAEDWLKELLAHFWGEMPEDLA